jgi:hypothetical protein
MWCVELSSGLIEVLASPSSDAAETRLKRDHSPRSLHRARNPVEAVYGLCYPQGLYKRPCTKVQSLVFKCLQAIRATVDVCNECRETRLYADAKRASSIVTDIGNISARDHYNLVTCHRKFIKVALKPTLPSHPITCIPSCPAAWCNGKCPWDDSYILYFL